MKAKIKIFLVLLVLATMSLGCGGGSGNTANKQVVLRYWRPFADSQEMDALISQYQAKHPNVRIEYAKKNIETYEDDLLNALASGNGPDIFAVNNTWTPKYLDKIVPAPQNYISYKDYKDAFVDVVVSDFTRAGNIYGVALTVDSLALYYNKDLLGTAGIAVPPKTWRELESDVQRIAREDQTGYFTRSGVAMGLSQNVNRAVDIVYLLMLQRGVVPWSQDGLRPQFADNISINGTYSSAGEVALDFYTSFANPSSLNYNWNSLSDYSIDAFANGRAAFLYSYPYTMQLLRQKSPSLNFDVAAVPQPDLERPAVNLANYFGEVVNKQSQNQDWAWDFLLFISSRDALDKYYSSYKYPSSRKDLIEYQINDPEIGVFAHANLTAKSFYKPDQKRFDAIISAMIDSVVLGGQSVSDAINQAQNQAATLTQVR